MLKICKDFQLTRRQVYELNSLFNSMIFVDERIRKTKVATAKNMTVEDSLISTIS